MREGSTPNASGQLHLEHFICVRLRDVTRRSSAAVLVFQGGGGTCGGTVPPVPALRRNKGNLNALFFYLMYTAVKSSRDTVPHIKRRAVKFTEKRHVSGLGGCGGLLQEASVVLQRCVGVSLSLFYCLLFLVRSPLYTVEHEATWSHRRTQRAW